MKKIYCFNYERKICATNIEGGKDITKNMKNYTQDPKMYLKITTSCSINRVSTCLKCLSWKGLSINLQVSYAW